MWTENKINKRGSVPLDMISDAVFEHLLVVHEILPRNNCLTVYSPPLSRGRIVLVAQYCAVGFCILVLSLDL